MLLTEHLVERTALAPFSARDISYIPRLNIVFAFISKNASSFLKAYLANLHRGRKFSQPTRNPHMPGNNGFQGVEQLGHRRMSEILNDPSVPKVVVGRHPVNRLVSAYLTRVVTWQRESYDSWNRSEWFVLRQLVAGLNHFSHAAPTINALQSDIS
ncbi:MAG: hypothetical protein EB075_13075, partial [Bacteroidetes bacterium]|nr:hypothetical protein [Bacteroidota bacterium]